MYCTRVLPATTKHISMQKSMKCSLTSRYATWHQAGRLDPPCARPAWCHVAYLEVSEHFIDFCIDICFVVAGKTRVQYIVEAGRQRRQKPEQLWSFMQFSLRQSTANTRHLFNAPGYDSLL